jgi:hypothetical protein
MREVHRMIGNLPVRIGRFIAVPEIVRTLLDSLAEHGEGGMILAFQDRPEAIGALAKVQRLLAAHVMLGVLAWRQKYLISK